jgi:outer membrane protein OmpA-like peptidoglycan-associated protein
VRTVSYGEERPLQRGDGESVWSVNRRAEFRVLVPDVAPGVSGTVQ